LEQPRNKAASSSIGSSDRIGATSLGSQGVSLAFTPAKSLFVISVDISALKVLVRAGMNKT